MGHTWLFAVLVTILVSLIEAQEVEQCKRKRATAPTMVEARNLLKMGFGLDINDQVELDVEGCTDIQASCKVRTNK